jgi:hypothetical protein
MLKLPVPDLRGGKPTILSAPCSPELKQIVQSLVERLRRVHGRAGYESDLL